MKKIINWLLRFFNWKKKPTQSEDYTWRTLIYLDVLNKNNRIYTSEKSKTAVENFNEKRQKIGCSFGEIGHPSRAEVTLNKAALDTKEIKIEGNKVLGNIRPLNTDNGRYLSENIDKFVFRTRSTGSVDDSGLVTVDEFFGVDAILKEQDSFVDYE